MSTLARRVYHGKSMPSSVEDFLPLPGVQERYLSQARPR